jgi:hypothetical protein
MDEKTRKMLRLDTIFETEKLFGGKDHNKFSDKENMTMLQYSALLNEEKNNYFSSLGDTYFRMSWQSFKELITKYGFIPAMEYDFSHDKYVDEFIIYYNLPKGLIICATSYFDKKSVNGGTLWGEIKANNKEDSHIVWSWLSTGGQSKFDDLIYETQQDVREGLFSILNTLESAGEFLPKWINKNRFLWLLDFTETKVEGYDYKKITMEKILKCPKEMQEIIGIV